MPTFPYLFKVFIQVMKMCVWPFCLLRKHDNGRDYKKKQQQKTLYLHNSVYYYKKDI